MKSLGSSGTWYVLEEEYDIGNTSHKWRWKCYSCSKKHTVAIYHIRFTLLNVASWQGYSGEKGPRGFAGDDGEPVWKNVLMINVNTLRRTRKSCFLIGSNCVICWLVSIFSSFKSSRLLATDCVYIIYLIILIRYLSTWQQSHFIWKKCKFWVGSEKSQLLQGAQNDLPLCFHNWYSFQSIFFLPKSIFTNTTLTFALTDVTYFWCYELMQNLINDYNKIAFQSKTDHPRTGYI